MAAVNQSNIYTDFCPSVIVQGVKCPYRHNGGACPYAHTKEEIQLRKCTREVAEPVCWSRNYKWPFICKMIHKDETKEEYADRLGFDPDHVKYDRCSYGKCNEYLNECNEIITKINKIEGIDNNRLNYAIIKKKFLEDLVQTKKKELDAWERQEAKDHRRDKYREQYNEMLYDRDIDYD
mgnify:FL=1